MTTSTTIHLHLLQALVTEAEVMIRAGLFIDPDLLRVMGTIESDVTLPEELRLRAASIKETGNG